MGLKEGGMTGEGEVVGLGGMEVVRVVVMGVGVVVVVRVAGWVVEGMERGAGVGRDWVEGWETEDWAVTVVVGRGCRKRRARMWKVGGWMRRCEFD